MASKIGNLNALTNYGYLLAYGEGVEVDKEEVVKYYTMAIEAGSTEALAHYGYAL